MERYLLFDSGCSMCNGLAKGVERESVGRLALLSLREPRVQTLLAQARPDWRWEPTLVEVEGDKTHVFTGMAMRTRILAVVGPRRAWRIAQLVAKSQMPTQAADASRRQLLRRGGMIALGSVGVALLGTNSAMAAGAKPRATENTPGTDATHEGVRSYTIQRSAGAIQVQFTHIQQKRSGVLGITGAANTRAELQLVRNGGTTLSIVFDRAEPSLEVEDGEGRKTRLILADNGWQPEGSYTTDVIIRNAADIALVGAIFSDFEVRAAPSTSTAATSVRDTGIATGIGSRAASAALASCPCNPGLRQRGSAVGSSRSLACDSATNDVQSKCINQWCWGCCQLLTCDCVCGVGDYFCSCGRSGDPCGGFC